MTEPSTDKEKQPETGGVKLTVVICLVIALIAGGIFWVIQTTEPEAERSTEKRITAMLVDVVEVKRGTFRPEISALGRVRPSSEVQLSPRISGEVLERSPDFTPGGFVPAGELLLKIDPADYENALQQRRSELEQAKANLRIEEGRQRVAESDFELLDAEIPEGARELALRKPQLATAKANVESAEAAVRQAQLDLERTEIKAPLDVQVIERNVDVGSQVSPGDDLGRLVGQRTYWVFATVPLASLPWIDRDSDGEGSPVALRDRSSWPKGVTREGHVQGLIGTLDERTRLARLLVTVDDPLARLPENEGKPALILDSILQATITGKAIEDVVRLERIYLRAGETVWVMNENNELKINQLDIVFRDEKYAYVKKGLEDGDRVVTTGLTTISEGAPLRLGEGKDE